MNDYLIRNGAEGEEKLKGREWQKRFVNFFVISGWNFKFIFNNAILMGR